jgi:5'-nucleotidase
MRRALVLIGLLLLGLVCQAQVEETPAPFHLLVVNDDGVDADGISALIEVLAADPAYRVTVAAPAEAQSGKGHALVYGLENPVAVRPHLAISGCPTWSVAATPATTVAIALSALLTDDPPDLVVSGINKGENMGRIAWYSGTVGAAREAALRGLPAIAFSLQRDWGKSYQLDYATAALWAKPLVDAVRVRRLPAGLYLNVNIPQQPKQIKGYRFTSSGAADDKVSFYEQVGEEDGARMYVSRWSPPDQDEQGTDIQGLVEGWVVIVPMTLDQTEYSAFPLLDQLSLVPPPSVSGE